MNRIAYLIRKTSGGMQTHITGLLAELDSSRYEPVVISPRAPKLFAFLDDIGIEYHEVEMSDSLSPKADFITARFVAKKLLKIKPSLLHIHGNKAAMIGWLATHLRPVKRTVITVHNFPSNLNSTSKMYPIVKQANRVVFNSAKRIIAVSSEIRRCLEKDIGVDERKVTVIPNGIDIIKWAFYRHIDRHLVKEELGLADSTVLIGAVGRLVPFKGFNILLKSLRRIIDNYPNAYLIILGDGPLRDTLEEQAKELGIAQYIKFLGFVDEPGRYMSALDVFVLPSINEPFGIVLLEAMAMGIPVVSTRSGGVLDIIEDGVTGLLAEPGDDKSLAESIERLLGDEDLRGQLAKNCQLAVQHRFTIKSMADKTFKVYEDLLS